MNNLQTKLKHRLLDLGITQKELADKMGVHKQVIANWLKGKAFPSEDNIEKIAKKTKRNFDDIKKIFEFNVQSKNIGSLSTVNIPLKINNLRLI